MARSDRWWRPSRRGVTTVVAGAASVLVLGLPASGDPGGPARSVQLLAAPTSSAAQWSGSGTAPCPPGSTRSASLKTEGFNSIPESRYNNGFYTASSPTGLAARSDVSSSDPSDHMFLPYVRGTVGARTMLAFATRSNQSDSAYLRTQVNSVDLRVSAGTSWQGRVFNITGATDDEGGQLGTWFEHKVRSGASAYWYVDNLQMYTCRSAPVTRIGGSNRYAVAAGVAATYPAGVPVVYLATGEKFPDAIGASALAARQDAPVLLTRGDSLPSATITQLQRLSPAEVVVLGGPLSVSDAVARQAGSYADRWSRVGGDTRYDVSAGLAQAYSPGVSVLYVAAGAKFPDALSVGALAGRQNAPVLLTPKTGLHPAVEEQIARLDPGRIVVVGGPASVDEAVLSQLRAHTSGTVTRVSGADRYDVSSAIAQQFPTGSSRVYIATGATFADALVGAARAGSQGVPVVLNDRPDLRSETATALDALDAGSGILLGGTASLSDLVMDQVGARVG